MKYVLIIPALDPPDTLKAYIKELKNSGFTDIILVDDGSKDKSVFSELKSEGICVLTHEINLGKGVALKDAYAYYRAHFPFNEYGGVITLDSDGQHLCKDVKRLADFMEQNPGKLILGSRDFTLPNVPPKSKFGNNLTKRIFKHLLRININDTQTGLRGIPNSLIEESINIPGDRFEYETSVLIKFGKNPGIAEVPIETVYLEENKGTHFNPIVDSFKIYSVIFKTFFRFIYASTSSFAVDMVMFALFSKVLFLNLPERILLSTVCARIISAVYNFLLNRNVVFSSKEGYFSSAVKYGVLCICIMLTSGFLVSITSVKTGIDEVIVKVIADTLLFFVSYNIQRKFIFKKS